LRADIVILQDPSDEEWMSKHNITNFYHMKVKEPGGASVGAAPTAATQSIRMSDISKTVLKELHSRDDERSTLAVAAGMKRARDLTEESASVSDAHIRDFGVKTTGKFGASFTSTGMSVRTRNEAAPETSADLREKRWRAVKALGKKGFVRIVTSQGNLNVELHCDLVPQTCDNFIQLCQNGYYNGTIFHRLIRNFMMQGGDPTGTGTGGESVWGGSFPDEFHPKLLHSECGVLSMANSGKDSNKSQFFITFKMASHLDRKHSVFGRVVGGLDVLHAMGNTPVDKDNRPLEPLTITEVR
jgi:peptidyl-prolyl cis-trans isomerase-like protein 2